ncbi:hypothetical protein F4779DRAFT_567954 [Xylariaceae sp. FL0662B]|nr:hypothetical protein F4779DRAFT_567954 [Xylariaceae sp. FL0662B]
MELDHEELETNRRVLSLFLPCFFVFFSPLLLRLRLRQNTKTDNRNANSYPAAQPAKRLPSCRWWCWWWYLCTSIGGHGMYIGPHDRAHGKYNI